MMERRTHRRLLVRDRGSSIRKDGDKHDVIYSSDADDSGYVRESDYVAVVLLAAVLLAEPWRWALTYLFLLGTEGFAQYTQTRSPQLPSCHRQR